MKQTSAQPLSMMEKTGYAVGDLSANLIFQTLMTFLAYFYTDVYGIPTGTATLIISTVGIVAALVVNPVIGILADRTNTRWGKFRPWILWTSLPFGLISILAFTTPELGPSGKVVYAFITYALLLVVYAANNLPYAALSGVLTGDMAERNSISAYRFIAVMVAQFIVQVLMYPIVDWVGHGDQTLGFSRVMTFLAIVGTLLLLITFLTTRERIVPRPEETGSLQEDLGDLLKNRPWVVMLALTILVFITLALKGGMYIYYFENYLDASSIATFLSGVGLSGFTNPAAYGFSVFNAGGIIMMIVGITFSKRLADRFGKRDVFGLALLLSTLFILVFYFFPPDAIALVFIAQMLHGFFYGITIPLLWAMIADVADYSEWKNGRRATAIIFSAMMIGLKLGLTFGQSLVTGILGFYNYDAGLGEQSASAINGIKLSVSIYAGLPFLVAVALLFVFYEINKKMEVVIEASLRQKRS